MAELASGVPTPEEMAAVTDITITIGLKGENLYVMAERDGKELGDIVNAFDAPYALAARILEVVGGIMDQAVRDGLGTMLGEGEAARVIYNKVAAEDV